MDLADLSGCGHNTQFYGGFFAAFGHQSAVRLPTDIEERHVFLVDPMLATGGSASAAISLLKNKGVKNIRCVNILAAPEGVRRINEDHPDIPVYCAALDECLNDHGYIVPGLGDAGDRIFGTK